MFRGIRRQDDVYSTGDDRWVAFEYDHWDGNTYYIQQCGIDQLYVLKKSESGGWGHTEKENEILRIFRRLLESQTAPMNQMRQVLRLAAGETDVVELAGIVAEQADARLTTDIES